MEDKNEEAGGDGAHDEEYVHAEVVNVMPGMYHVILRPVYKNLSRLFLRYDLFKDFEFLQRMARCILKEGLTLIVERAKTLSTTGGKRDLFVSYNDEEEPGGGHLGEFEQDVTIENVLTWVDFDLDMLDGPHGLELFYSDPVTFCGTVKSILVNPDVCPEWISRFIVPCAKDDDDSNPGELYCRSCKKNVAAEPF